MKRKVTAMLCLLLVLSTVGSISAYAATIDEDTTGTTLTYTKEAPPVDVNLPLYEIAIPSEMSLNAGDTMPIYLTANNMAPGQRLTVYIDGSNMDEQSLVPLYGTKGQAPAEVMIGYYDSDGMSNTLGGGPGLYPVAAFESGNIRPVLNGTIFFRVQNADELIADTYTGTVNFLLRVTD